MALSKKLWGFLSASVVAGVVLAIGLNGPMLAQNAGQVLLTMTGTELIQVYAPNTAAISYTTTSSMRDGRFYTYQAPLTGFTVLMTPQQSTVSLNPAGTLAAGTVTLPATATDGKFVTIFSSQTITALTINTTNGATFVPAVVTTLAANASVSYIYDKANNQWHRFM